MNLVVPPIRNQDQETPERVRVGPYYLCWEKDENGTACDRSAGHLGNHTWQMEAEAEHFFNLYHGLPEKEEDRS